MGSACRSPAQSSNHFNTDPPGAQIGRQHAALLFYNI
jgi:hypothetical protein